MAKVKNTVKKGRKAYNEVARGYRKAGFLIGAVEKRAAKDHEGVYRGGGDLFGLFDAIVIHPVHGTAYLQITSNRPHTHRNYVEWVRKWKGQVVQYVRYDGRGRAPATYKRFQYTGDGYTSEAISIERENGLNFVNI